MSYGIMLIFLLKMVGRQNWIRYGIRHRIISFFYPVSRIASHEFETDFFGLRYRGNLNSYIDWHVYFYGAYEKEYLLFLQSLVSQKKDPVFIDIGANVGQHSLFMSLFCSQVYSFEPNPVVRERIYEKIRNNAVKNISVSEVGLGLRTEEIPFYAPKGSNQGTGSFVSGYADNNEETGVLLKVVNGDEYLGKLAIEKIDLIKIDVEGFEKYVLSGLRESLKKYRPIITIEFSQATKDSFNNLNELMSLLPPDYNVNLLSPCRAFGVLFNSTECKLEKFDFDKAGGDLILYPSGLPLIMDKQ